MGNRSMIRWRPFELFVWMWMGIQCNAMQCNTIQCNPISSWFETINPIESMIVSVLTHLGHGSTVRYPQSLRLVREFGHHSGHDTNTMSLVGQWLDPIQIVRDLSRAKDTTHGIEQTRDIGLGEMDGGWRTSMMDLLAPWSIRISMH